MTVTALLRDPAGVEREYSTEWDESGRDIVEFMWSDGNYACDCNRSLFLYNWDATRDIPCGNTIVYLSLKIDGEEIYSERD
jgi:hypothetical protein